RCLTLLPPSRHEVIKPARLDREHPEVAEGAPNCPDRASCTPVDVLLTTLGDDEEPDRGTEHCKVRHISRNCLCRRSRALDLDPDARQMRDLGRVATKYPGDRRTLLRVERQTPHQVDAWLVRVVETKTEDAVGHFAGGVEAEPVAQAS